MNNGESFFNDLRKQRLDLMMKENEVEECEMPTSWNLVSAMDYILGKAKKSKLRKEFWESVKIPIDFLTERLELTRMQVLFLALLTESGEPLPLRKMANYLDCSRLSMMVHSEELEDLIKKRWVVRRTVRDMGARFESFGLENGVVTALRRNEKFEPMKIDGLTEQQFMDMLESYLDVNMHNLSTPFEFEEDWMEALCDANPQLPLCQAALGLNDIHEMSLLLLMVYDYAQWADSEDEGLNFSTIDDNYPYDYECNFVREALKEGTHTLFARGYIEYKCEDGMVNNEKYVLTTKAKEELLSEYKASKSRVKTPQTENRNLKKHTAIKEKELFFNEAEQMQIERLTSLLSQENLPAIQQRLEDQGMRKGFACLFYGGPGTGKTETVLQIARKTGRNVMQIDIAGMRDKWVGESEKNIKAVFENYRKLCRNSEVMPILFFNEADGIINKRTENISHSVDKMDNAMQNIILQEIEDLEGILIATTNLTSNLDSAFERRFLFKVEFNKPNTDVKAKIWSSMLKNISDDDAHKLASEFDFSGGQIENIARKRTIDFILSGEFADMEAIEGYCRNELLDDSKKRKPVVGFK